MGSVGVAPRRTIKDVLGSFFTSISMPLAYLVLIIIIAAGAAVGIALRARFHPHTLWNVLRVIDYPKLRGH